MTAPDLVHGVWARRSVSIDGGPHFETQHVVWLQAGASYADLRVPFHPAADARCFAGWSGWDGDRYRWTHTLDLEGPDSPAGDDLGDLNWEDGAVVERGMFPTADGDVAYTEVWVRLPDADGPWQVHEAPGAVAIRIGSHALAVEHGPAGFAAAYRRRRPDGWEIEHGLGDAGRLPIPGALEHPWRLVHAGDTTVVNA